MKRSPRSVSGGPSHAEVLVVDIQAWFKQIGRSLLPYWMR